MRFSKFFSNLQEAPWYRLFLNPVMKEIDNNTRLLDIGTGSGKMLETLSLERNINCTGTDTSADMLKEAKGKLKNTDATLHLIKAGDKMPFDKNSFDAITICSVLFHLDEDAIDKLLEDALSLLKEDGKIIVHTPTGRGNYFLLSKHYFSFKNKGIYIWFRSTKNRARNWTEKNYLNEFSSKRNLVYKRDVVMNGFAQIEIISK